MLRDLMKKIYRQEKIPSYWRESLIVPIYEEKGDIQDCRHYQGIKLMSHTRNTWKRVMNRMIRDKASTEEEQFGFMPGRGTIDVVFGLGEAEAEHRIHKPGKSLRQRATPGSLEVHEK